MRNRSLSDFHSGLHSPDTLQGVDGISEKSSLQSIARRQRGRAGFSGCVCQFDGVVFECKWPVSVFLWLSVPSTIYCTPGQYLWRRPRRRWRVFFTRVIAARAKIHAVDRGCADKVLFENVCLFSKYIFDRMMRPGVGQVFPYLKSTCAVNSFARALSTVLSIRGILITLWEYKRCIISPSRCFKVCVKFRWGLWCGMYK